MLHSWNRKPLTLDVSPLARMRFTTLPGAWRLGDVLAYFQPSCAPVVYLLTHRIVVAPAGEVAGWQARGWKAASPAMRYTARSGRQATLRSVVDKLGPAQRHIHVLLTQREHRATSPRRHPGPHQQAVELTGNLDAGRWPQTANHVRKPATCNLLTTCITPRLTAGPPRSRPSSTPTETRCGR